MKRSPMLLPIAALILGAAISAFAQGGPPPTRGRTAGEARKNIQVLKDLPAQQVDPVMDYIASSLGVQCNFCHVIDTTGWYMEKDDKAAKKTARKMMQMVMDLNARSFGGRDAIGCYTCHRGSTEPLSSMALPIAMMRPSHPEGAADGALPTPADLVTKYETALGGAEAIAKVSSRKLTGVSVDGMGKESPLEIVQAPGKYLSKTTMREGMTRTIAMNGGAGWMSSPRGVRDLPPDAIEELQGESALFPVAALRAQVATMYVTGKDSVNGAMAYRAVAPGKDDKKVYYFDAANGLLVREMSLMATPVGTIPDQTDFMDYRDVSGVKVPFVVRTAAVDPRDGATHRFATIEQNVKIDDAMFAKPEAKK